MTETQDEQVQRLQDALREVDLLLGSINGHRVVERELAAEVDRLRAELKRYTDVYADPEGAPGLMSSCEAPDERPLTGIAAAAQLRIDAMLRGEEPPSWAAALKHPSDEEVAG